MRAWPLPELGKKTGSKNNVIFLAAVRLFWTPLWFVYMLVDVYAEATFLSNMLEQTDVFLT